MIKAIIFDIGGVVVNPGTLKNLRKRYAKMFGVPYSKFAFYFYKWVFKWRVGKITEAQFWDGVLSDLKIRADKKKLRHMMHNYQTLDKSVVSIAEKLKPNYKLGVISNHLPEWFGIIRKRYKFDRLFGVIVTSFSAGVAKPRKKIYKIALREMNCRPNEAIFIDNEFANILAAKSIGIKAILFRNSIQLKKDLKKFGVKI